MSISIRGFRTSATVAFLASSLAACGDGSSADGTSSAASTGSGGSGGAALQSISIPFEARVGSTPFDCKSTYMLGTPPASAAIGDVRIYVHDVRLLDKSGNETPLELDQDGLWQYQDVALLDFEDKTGACANGTTETNKVIHGVAPKGDYVGVAFKIGLPETLNHLDVANAPSPLNLSALFWVWTAGYTFLRVDLQTTAPKSPFFMHLGAGDCVGDPSIGETAKCAAPNVPEVRLDSFRFADGQVGVVDLGALLGVSNVATDKGGAPGCMSEKTDPECAPLFGRLGLDLASGKPAGTQSFIHAE